MTGAVFSLERVLEQLVEAGVFTRTQLLRRVLAYLVQAELQDRADTLTPYRVAVEAFGKPKDFDPATSASVRVEMARLRRLLDAYARQHPEMPSIEIPSGGYRPRVRAPAGARAPGSLVAFAAPASGPGVMVLGFEGALAPALRHVGVGFGRTLFDELTPYRWLFIVDALDLDPARPGLFELCCDRYECQFMLRGNLRQADGDAWRVRVELLDAPSRGMLWFHEYHVPADGLVDRQREIAVDVARTIGQPFGIITQSGITAPARTDSVRSTAADLSLRFHYYMAMGRTPETNAQLIERAEVLLGEAPLFALGWAVLGGLLRDQFVQHLVPDAGREAALTRAAYCLERATDIDPRLSLAAYLLATVRYYQRDAEGFHTWARRTLELNNHNPDHLTGIGTLLCMAGQGEEGMPLIDAGGLQNHHAPYYRVRMILACYAAGHWERALEYVRAMPSEGLSAAVHLSCAYVYAALQMHDDARAALVHACAAAPSLHAGMEAAVARMFLSATLRSETWSRLAPLMPAAT